MYQSCYLQKIYYATRTNAIQKHYAAKVFSMILEELPHRIRNLRERAGLGQGELAKMAGITQAQVSNYEAGKQFPGVESLVRIASAFGITVAELIEQDEPKYAQPRPPRKEEMALFILDAIGISQTRIDQISYILGEKSHKY